MTVLGVEVLLAKRRELLRGKRIGLVSNYTVTDSRLTPIIDLFHEATDFTLVKLFGPEHGMRNSAREGEHVSSETDAHTGLLAYSLYGDTRRPNEDMLSGIDVMVVDLHDIGTRYYTNMNTMAYVMEACAAAHLPCIVLDRPNPLGGAVEGNIVSEGYASFVGMAGLANRHGLTMGEIALLHNSRLSTPCQLTVVEMESWKRGDLLPDTGIPFVASSPNTTCFDMALLYPGTCLLEGVNFSLGRGTTHPFEFAGAPFVDGHQLARAFNQAGEAGVVARPVYFVPNYNQYTGELCSGIQLHVTDAKSLSPVRAGLVLLQTLHDMYPEEFRFVGEGERDKLFIDLLAGTPKLRQLIREGRALDYLTDAKAELQAYCSSMETYHLYS